MSAAETVTDLPTVASLSSCEATGTGIMNARQQEGMAKKDNVRSNEEPIPVHPSSFIVHPLFLDWAERLVVVALYGWLVTQIVQPCVASGHVHVGNLALLLSEGLVVFFILIRRGTTEVSRRPVEWLMAMGATVLALLARPAGDGWSLCLLPAVVGAPLC